MFLDLAPESRTTPMPDLPGGVDIATIVSSRFNEKTSTEFCAAAFVSVSQAVLAFGVADQLHQALPQHRAKGPRRISILYFLWLAAPYHER